MSYYKVSILANLVFLLCLLRAHGKLDKYCSICENHTMCKYQGIGPDCKEVGGFGVSQTEKREIVDVHNWYRKIIAGGHEISGAGGPQPKGSNLMKMEWDEDLARVAQRWADQCRLEHDVCRDDARWKVGQNIYWKWKYPVHTVNWTEAITSWYKEVSLFNPADVKSFKFDARTGHYTQMLWHDTHRIGCGRRDYGYNKLYVCNYGPTGNWIGEPMYTVGEPCSKCPAGTSCNDLLCDSRGSNGTNKPTHKNTKLTRTTQFLTRSKLFSSTTPVPTTVKKAPDTSKSKQEDIQENVILDEETDSALEEIKIKIKNLLKRVIKKTRLYNY